LLAASVVHSVHLNKAAYRGADRSTSASGAYDGAVPKSEVFIVAAIMTSTSPPCVMPIPGQTNIEPQCNHGLWSKGFGRGPWSESGPSRLEIVVLTILFLRMGCGNSRLKVCALVFRTTVTVSNRDSLQSRVLPENQGLVELCLFFPFNYRNVGRRLRLQVGPTECLTPQLRSTTVPRM
jgi:hypothetical protein